MSEVSRAPAETAISARLEALPERLAGWTRTQRAGTISDMSDEDVRKLRAALTTVIDLLRTELERGTSDEQSERLAHRLAQVARDYSARTATSRAPVADQSLARALQLLHEAPGARWTLRHLARRAGTSRAALVRKFRSFTGMSPQRYLARLRMDLAAERLLQSDASLAEIAREVGYDSEFSFNRAFKRHRGLPPGVFRRSAANDRGRILAVA
jgi:transcriptional regulator GlxA family with amidase domain